MRVGVIGCGNISGRYLANFRRFDEVQVVACADVLAKRAEERAAEFGVAKACGVDDLLGDPEIELVVNLTVPGAHAGVTRAALTAGKHVYSEKPLATSLGEGREIVDAAEHRGLLVGCAPDTFLGAGLQTARRLLDDGVIGEAVSAAGFMLCHGHEDWHPDPAFYYRRGGGPMLDMGPYYLTALISLLGAVRRVTGSARVTFPERTITSEPRRGSRIPVETPTQLAAILDFASGPIAVLITSFDVWLSTLLPLEIHGTDGTMLAPDPNVFGGPVRFRRPEDAGWTEARLVSHYVEESRGLGVADMAEAIRTGRRPRADVRMAYHVLEVMEAVERASRTGRHVDIESRVRRPEPLPG